MSTLISVRGNEDIEVEESFNLVRQRLNQMLTGTKRDGSENNTNKPLNDLTFKHAESGMRIAILPEHIIGIADTGDLEEDDDDE